ncbi:hypothetical protein GCM10020221_02450 [Streptomyces thioluteus]|uniref:Uncharacterized protein n=1 Tax=Streptomyces thioluteus TaxID=66431 RepID=A0ABN3WC15_STRTU
MSGEVQPPNGHVAGAEGLHRTVRTFGNGEPQSLCFFEDNPVRFLENVRIDRSVNLDALTDVVDRAAGAQGSGEPDSQLGGGQRPLFIQ